MLSISPLPPCKVTREPSPLKSSKASEKPWSTPASCPGQHSGAQPLTGLGLLAPRKIGVWVNPKLGALTCPNQPGLYSIYDRTTAFLRKSREQGGGGSGVDLRQHQKEYSEVWGKRCPVKHRRPEKH